MAKSKLKALRKSSGLSQAQVAAALAVDQSTVSRLENGVGACEDRDILVQEFTELCLGSVYENLGVVRSLTDVVEAPPKEI